LDTLFECNGAAEPHDYQVQGSRHADFCHETHVNIGTIGGCRRRNRHDSNRNE